MSPRYRKLSEEEAQTIKAEIGKAKGDGEGIAFDKDSGEFLGAAPTKAADPDKVNILSKFNVAG